MKSENMISTKLNELLNLSSENECLEFKEAKNTYDFDKLGKYFSALCNEANLGGKNEAWLIFGVKDEGHLIVGTKFRSNPVDLQHLKQKLLITRRIELLLLRFMSYKQTEVG